MKNRRDGLQSKTGIVRTDVAFQKVIGLVREKRFDEAIEECNLGINQWPKTDIHEAWHNLGYVYWAMGERDRAMEAVTVAVELAPKDRSHLMTRARWAMALGNLELSIDDWTALIKVEQDIDSQTFVNAALANRAFVRIRLGHLEEANDDLQRVTELDEVYIENRLWTIGDLKSLAGRR